MTLLELGSGKVFNKLDVRNKVCHPGLDDRESEDVDDLLCIQAVILLLLSSKLSIVSIYTVSYQCLSFVDYFHLL